MSKSISTTAITIFLIVSGILSSYGQTGNSPTIDSLKRKIFFDKSDYDPIVQNLDSAVRSQLPDLVNKRIFKLDTLLHDFSRSQFDNITILTDDGGLITTDTYKKFLDKSFTYLSYNRGTFPTGNSASLDLLENETKLTLSLAAKKQSEGKGKRIFIGTAGTQLKLDDGVGELFKGGIAATGTTIFGNFSFLPGTAKFKYEVARVLPGGISKTVPLDVLNYKRQLFLTQFYAKYGRDYALKYGTLLCRLIGLTEQISYYKNCENVSALLAEKDRIEKELTAAGLYDNDAATLFKKITSQYFDDLYNLEIDEAAWDWFKFSWISGGIAYTHESYTTYDIALSLANRFGTQEFDAWSGKITKNWYFERGVEKGFIRSLYYNIGYDIRRINNFSVIDGKDILRTINSSPGGDTTYIYQTTKKARDISGKTYETGWQHSFSGVLTTMTGKKKNFGLNLLAQLQTGNFTKPIYNTRAGLLFRMINNNQDPDDKKSEAKVNFELFIQFPDMSDVALDHKTVWEKRVIGISTSVPFKKLFFK